MQPGRTVHICRACRQIVDDEPQVIAAAELLRVDSFDGSDYIEGVGVFFHLGCWPGDGAGYRWRGETTVLQAIRDR